MDQCRVRVRVRPRCLFRSIDGIRTYLCLIRLADSCPGRAYQRSWLPSDRFAAHEISLTLSINTFSKELENMFRQLAPIIKQISVPKSSTIHHRSPISIRAIDARRKIESESHPSINSIISNTYLKGNHHNPTTRDQRPTQSRRQTTTRRRYLNKKRQFLPQEENPLPLDPIRTFRRQRHKIESEQQGHHNRPHFDPSQTSNTNMISMLIKHHQRHQKRNRTANDQESKQPTYFIPKQSLGPTLNGRNTALSSS